MNLYHYSPVNVLILKPQIGPNRNSGEDPLAKGKPVIYLTTCGNSYFEGAKYKYIVEIDDKDEKLFPDRPFNSAMEQMIKMGGIVDDTRWYFYTKNIIPIGKEILEV